MLVYKNEAQVSYLRLIFCLLWHVIFNLQHRAVIQCDSIPAIEFGGIRFQIVIIIELKFKAELCRACRVNVLQGSFFQCRREPIINRRIENHARRIHARSGFKVCLLESADSKCAAVDIHQSIPVGRRLIDRGGFEEVDEVVVRDRRHLSEDGLVIATLVISKDTKEILNGPDILSRGFILEETKPEILDEAKCIIIEIFDRMLSDGFDLDCADLQVEVRRELKKFFQRILKRRPVIYPIIIEV